MIVAFTGHRPPKGGLTYSHVSERDREVVAQVRAWLRENKPEGAIVGGALGFDTLAARACFLEQIPYALYAPCRGQESRWPAGAQLRYRVMRDWARTVLYVHDGAYNATCMHQRDRCMVDAADVVVAFWDGSSGGTAHTVGYARRQGRPVTNLLEKTNEN